MCLPYLRLGFHYKSGQQLQIGGKRTTVYIWTRVFSCPFPFPTPKHLCIHGRVAKTSDNNLHQNRYLTAPEIVRKSDKEKHDFLCSEYAIYAMRSFPELIFIRAVGYKFGAQTDMYDVLAPNLYMYTV